MLEGKKQKPGPFIRKRPVCAVFCVCLLVSCMGCFKFPRSEIETAWQAVETASDLGAVQYAPKEFKMAQDTLAAALKLIEKEERKFALFREFQPGREKLEESVKLAKKAGQAARDERQREQEKERIDQPMRDTTGKKLGEVGASIQHPVQSYRS